MENVACNSASTPSRFEAVPLKCCGIRRSLKLELRELHAKFSGARCFLPHPQGCAHSRGDRHNAPFGARCFLTRSPAPTCLSNSESQCTFWRSVLSDTLKRWPQRSVPLRRLNAPFGARCFLTRSSLRRRSQSLSRLNAPYGAQCFLTP